MRNNFIKQWLCAIFYPVPKAEDTVEMWEKFAQGARYSQVEMVFKQNYDKLKDSWEGRGILKILLCRLAQMPRPKLSKKFCKRNHKLIFGVDSLETAEQEVNSHSEWSLPKILVDKQRRCLGIVVNNDLIISTALRQVVNFEVARRLRLYKMVNYKDILAIEEKAEYINLLYKKLYGSDLYAKYWVDMCCDVYLWTYPDHAEYSPAAKKEQAFLMFKM